GNACGQENGGYRDKARKRYHRKLLRNPSILADEGRHMDSAVRSRKAHQVYSPLGRRSEVYLGARSARGPDRPGRDTSARRIEQLGPPHSSPARGQGKGRARSAQVRLGSFGTQV